jgi:hypothetical protein
MKSARTKACSISRGVRQAVYERDKGRCILCGRPGIPNAHFIPKGGMYGGLGIEQNVVCLCPHCHHDYDNGYHKDKNLRSLLGEQIEHYLRSCYEGWNKEDCIYDKWRDYEESI